MVDPLLTGLVSMPTVCSRRTRCSTSLCEKGVAAGITRGAGTGSATTVGVICSSLAANRSARSKDWV
jgi:hypothetical protein